MPIAYWSRAFYLCGCSLSKNIKSGCIHAIKSSSTIRNSNIGRICSIEGVVSTKGTQRTGFANVSMFGAYSFVFSTSMTGIPSVASTSGSVEAAALDSSSSAEVTVLEVS